MTNFRASVAVIVVALAVLHRSDAHAWGSTPHCTITKAAAAALPPRQRQLFGDELTRLADRYCLIPDMVFTDPELAPYATMDAYPGVRYLRNLHVRTTPVEDYAVLRHFLSKATDALRTGKVADAARFSGTLSHVLEDWGCPAHAVPDDNMITLMKQLLPPPETLRDTPLHGPIENGSFDLGLLDYQPRLLGTSVDEAAFILLRRSQDATVHARGQTLPIMRALYAADTNAVNAAQQVAALYDARLVADALFTLGCLAQQRFEGPPAADTTDVSSLYPLEAPDLYMPQSTFFSKPYWGHATRGTILFEGRPMPLVLNVSENGQTAQKTFATGIGTGTRSTLSYLLPSNVYTGFSARVGLHAHFGVEGQVTFEINGNGKPLASSVTVTGKMPSRVLDVPLAGVTNLQLTVTSAGGNGTGNYAVWAEPRLLKP